ncbi:MAG: radical SAM protein [Proteobacteria bacterium]|nr:radical SAM protein [Pseudomonadota bacterium]
MNEKSSSDILSSTKSICPVCLKRLSAVREKHGDDVYLVKKCFEHGEFKTIIWRGPLSFASWKRPKKASSPRHTFTKSERGCPHDCGLCPSHGQHTCTALIEITTRCNLRCKVCFADAGSNTAADPSLDKIAFFYDRLMQASGSCNVQLSGGEPTVRDDLADIVRLGREKGFSFLQLNTNGIRLAEDAAYAKSLKDAGLSSVFLQFDGLSDEVHLALRGRALAEIKEMAIVNCALAGLGVVLVPTIVPGVNTQELAGIIDYAARFSPTVRGVHFQPVSYFGRYPEPPQDSARITLPEILMHIEGQTNGEIPARLFSPPSCEHALCSFHANFLVQEDHSLKGITSWQQNCCAAIEKKGEIPAAVVGREKSVTFTARQWSAPSACKCSPAEVPENEDELDFFLRRAKTHTFSISGMAFQDAWNLDIERLQGCCIHVVSPEGNLIPFCAYNLTSSQGRGLHRAGGGQ